MKVTLVNESPMPHSIDFHAARIPMDVAFRTIGPGEELEFEFVARDPGAFHIVGAVLDVCDILGDILWSA